MTLEYETSRNPVRITDWARLNHDQRNRYCVLLGCVDPSVSEALYTDAASDFTGYCLHLMHRTTDDLEALTQTTRLALFQKKVSALKALHQKMSPVEQQLLQFWADDDGALIRSVLGAPVPTGEELGPVRSEPDEEGIAADYVVGTRGPTGRFRGFKQPGRPPRDSALQTFAETVVQGWRRLNESKLALQHPTKMRVDGFFDLFMESTVVDLNAEIRVLKKDSRASYPGLEARWNSVLIEQVFDEKGVRRALEDALRKRAR